ncbi:hypothetical protein A2962_00610 [Candidatus Woesebacteria bacterium RIFCSPLOWO2_01_FULL_39_61]|uniref:Homing endonuclease LAGLIDADG domain-containing protein n=1 Tax=Candidatus Woesebacteria bacterium RIFCSPHIGHO2_02_FULL_39_13 TaxID=1802505 RepID=A0A1F7Z282_9BACT|nr:MAG: hypothetical protein A2692_04740 [Candidatus Woesebacteria bacterium RIFCSPHIGHO2_01_FULL_39_95]OGM33590.1 MAG: hypothetical protein A3D01_01385 [Candidatus Woesebacteria bacterium RIFCSPHIGHO2_02_FULL_39_13]OGM36680.1 MAG: hypothetical protein A3E13_00105 [Candidatus Woesebacteria bacterium RIFCSPHIGHO2_12_FULL_40_20]OGM68553.1 MAG: hypothetical protein A2962_00610 [Candidatus Woesebacteria bacterium RIFCSPLOWO2_01_FULL_39_61]OGM73428.1 MAG: hypothetical protein A3H19_00730 [Candidatus
MPSSFFTPVQLERWYIQGHLSTYDIAAKSGCDSKTVYYWLKKYKISTRPRKIVSTNKTALEKLYKSGFSLKEIGKQIGCTPSAVLRKFRKFDISTRSPWEANTFHIKYKFSNNLLEKAYLIGFRIGDLNVAQRSPISSIIVKSNTTRVEQVLLLKKLFSKYGPVWISRPKSKPSVYHFTATVNNSFSFLLTKHSSIPRWIVRSKKLFFGFLAGYSDAEGSIGVYNGRATFRIGSYDKTILDQIHQFLQKNRVKNTILLETKAGRHGERIHNGDFYRVNIRDKQAINLCLTQLLPYLKHKNRIRCAELALKNVQSRM